LPSVVLEKMTEVTLAQMQAKTDAQYRQDDEGTLINLIANHPNTPSHILEMFITNQTVELHQRLGENWCSNFLYRSVASNISTPIYILEKLVSDPQFSNSSAREDARKILRHRS
jgi:hypothetical protein